MQITDADYRSLGKLGIIRVEELDDFGDFDVMMTICQLYQYWWVPGNEDK